MANYYYAYSGHKYGLDRVKRAVTLIKLLKTEGIETNLLVNDFRAGLAAKELGVEDSVTVETIMDVDVMAERGDAVFLDTPEDDRGRVESYSAEYTPLFCVSDTCDAQSLYGEIMLKPSCEEDENCISSLIIDPEYFEILPKEDRTLFFLNDADYDKEVLRHSDFFEGLGMELLLGHYFFVKYEDDLAKIFDVLHEPEEYSELIRTSSRVVTASAQCALEARAAEADVIYMREESDSLCLMEQFKAFGIKIIDGFDKKSLEEMISTQTAGDKKVTNQSHIIVSKVINKLNL
ncbi:MAG: hypothetical protein U9Q90_02210 [Campylobacterota bacterium]|nr:hypothetical protein [Campylobacterota bacterium]